MTVRNEPAPAAEPGPLEGVIDRSERIQGTVEQCAEELSSVNEVIKSQLDANPELSDVHGVAEAVNRNESIEVKLQSCAEELTEVNEALVVEAQQRKMLAHELEVTRVRERAARHAALHDPLTGLPNRMLFEDRLDHGLAQARRHGWALAVLFLDLDGFKRINDTQGHEAGDLVLQTVAARLRRITRADDTICRYGGDEFLYLMLELKSSDDAATVARKIIDAISAPVALPRDAGSVSVGCSVGIAFHADRAAGADALLERADRAMYQAKREGTGVALDDGSVIRSVAYG